MGVWVLYDGEHERAILYDSVTETAFGPGFVGDDAREAADCFLRYLALCCEPAASSSGRVTHDARFYGSVALDELHTRWIHATQCRRCGTELDHAAVLDLGDESFREAMAGDLVRCDHCVADGYLRGARARKAREEYVSSREDPWCYVRATDEDDARVFFGVRRDAEVRDLGPWRSVVPCEDDEDEAERAYAEDDEAPHVYAVWIHGTDPSHHGVDPVATSRSAS